MPLSHRFWASKKSISNFKLLTFKYIANNVADEITSRYFMAGQSCHNLQAYDKWYKRSNKASRLYWRLKCKSMRKYIAQYDN